MGKSFENSYMHENKCFSHSCKLQFEELLGSKVVPSIPHIFDFMSTFGDLNFLINPLSYKFHKRITSMHIPFKYFLFKKLC